MDKPEFVYVTYIQSTPENVWNALTDGEITKEYWFRRRNVSDWKPGSKWEHQDCDNPATVDIVGQVIESEPPRRLVITWAFPAEAGIEAKRSRVTFEIEPYEDVVRLRVTHDRLESGSDMERGITRGWPLVLASLKTFLETGRPMAMATKRKMRPPE
jgi:uncharacterized protein YndB with AHSA1/START domain